MTPLVPEAYLETRRRQIIEAAVMCFAQKGFHQTTMQDICKAAELSPGAVYNYFRSKEDIVAACAEVSQQRNEEIFVNAAVEGRDTMSGFYAVMSAFFSLAKQEGITEATKFDLEMWAESTRNKRVADILQKNKDALMRQIVNAVKRGQGEDIFSSELDSEAVAQVLFSLFLGLEVQMASNPGMDVDAYAAVSKAIVNGTFSREKENQE